jgi:hypothetical protein
MPGMSAALQIGIGADEGGSIGLARATAQAGGDITPAPPAAAAGSIAYVRASWKGILEALGMKAAPTGKAAESPGQLTARVLPVPRKEAGRKGNGHAEPLQLVQGADRATPKDTKGQSDDATTLVVPATPAFAPFASNPIPPANIAAPVAGIFPPADSDPSPSPGSQRFQMHSLEGHEWRSRRIISAVDMAGQDAVCAPGGITQSPSEVLAAHEQKADSAPRDAVDEGSADSTETILPAVPGAREDHASDALLKAVPSAERRAETTSDSTSRTSGVEIPAPKSEGQSRPLRAAGRPAVPVSPAPSWSGGPGGTRISKAAAHYGANNAFNPATDSAGPVGKVDSLNPAQLNAPASREISGYAGERQISTPQHSAAAVRDPFAALDQDHATPPATWIHAGTHHAEAGYFDPALGWIGVRADATLSGVHAALVPGSAEAAQVLGSHVAGLNAYLSEHHREAAMVTMTAPQDGREGPGSGPGNRPSARERDGQKSQGRNEESGLEGTSQRGAVTLAGMTAVRGSAGAGKHISVMA